MLPPIPELIRVKREGGEIPPEQLQEFISGYVAGEIADYQVSALLMAIFFRGMTSAEAAALTRAMLESGERHDLSAIPGPKVDKHSTGGVGDKVSLILAPVVAACGGIVPMVSGRGLGHTGGTLDKLDAIPGYRWDLNQEQFRRQLEKIGCAIIGQTDRFVPADKKLYALRDVTATVESVPLICASILSKKAAAGTQYLVMDVKCGSGAFMDSIDRARELSDALISIGEALGLKVSAVLTQMSQPLGETIGNALEVRESVAILKGKGPQDSTEITLDLCAEMLLLAGLAPSAMEARAKVDESISSGKALEKFAQWIEAQGGNPRLAEDPTLAEVSSDIVRVPFRKTGVIQRIDTRALGVAANRLGAGRIKTTDVVDPRVGIVTPYKVGHVVRAGEDALTLYTNGRDCSDVIEAVLAAHVISDEPQDGLALILERRGAHHG